MAFTLLSVACLDKAGCSLTIEDGECIIRSPRPYRTLLGSVPCIDNLYRLVSSAIKALSLQNDTQMLPTDLSRLANFTAAWVMSTSRLCTKWSAVAP
jgi:hypothetical protein